MKKRKQILDKGTEARRVARKSGIAPGATQVIPDKRKRPPKHKKQWLETQAESPPVIPVWRSINRKNGDDPPDSTVPLQS